MPDKDQETRERAHQLWEQAGRPEGQHADHWDQAERELREGKDAERATGGQGDELTGTDQAEATAADAAHEIQKADDAGGPTEQLAEGDQLDEQQ